MKQQSIPTARGEVAYWMSEDWQQERETVFFFPGLTADHTLFSGQFGYFLGRYNLLAWDAPGHGASRPYGAIDMDDACTAVLSILDRHGVARILAVGQSFGGYVAQALLARNPERVFAFAGIGTSPYGRAYYSAMDAFWLRQVGWMCLCYPFEALKRAAAKGASCTKQGQDNMQAMLSVYERREYVCLLQSSYHAFLADNRDLDISCPLLITHGEQDGAGKVRTYAKQWAQKTGCPLVVIPGAGHNANADNPQEMNRVLDAFFTRVLQTP